MNPRHALAVVLLLGIGPSIAAQQTAPDKPAPPAPAAPSQEPVAVDPVQGPTFRTGTDAVSVDVAVLDRQHRAVDDEPGEVHDPVGRGPHYRARLNLPEVE